MKKNFQLKSVAVLVIGMVLIVSAVLVFSKQEARAATSYSFTWSVTKALNINPGGLLAGRLISVGPGEWQVTGSIGSNSVSEIWTLTKVRSLSSLNADELVVPYQNFLSIGSFNLTSVQEQANGTSLRVTAPYTAQGSNGGIFVPTGWTVTGTIN